uniref:Relaxin n=1 Tax=Balaenoptera edeni TaxID=9769 RepID=RELX_BALED|nr:RecName: Full=Relaxin; Contains: RecName: Full=Relaxin B chain; Contains: RecName: Full=Relaxin A chain [Balaenoptera edeni]
QSTNDLIKACGRELVRLWVEICGSVSWGRTALRMTLSEKCCQVGCIRKDIARLC